MKLTDKYFKFDYEIRCNAMDYKDKQVWKIKETRYNVSFN